MVKGRNPGIKVPGLHEAHPSVRKAFQQIITKLGQKSSPVFDNLIIGGDLTVGGELLVTGGLTVGGDLTLSGLTASRLVATDATKTLESTDAVSWIDGTDNQIIVTDDTDGTVTLSTPQDIHTGASPEFVAATLSGLTASRLMYGDGSKLTASVADLKAWIAGTTNRITVTDDGDGSVTLSTPQDTHTGASPTFNVLTLTGLQVEATVVTGAASITTGTAFEGDTTSGDYSLGLPALAGAGRVLLICCSGANTLTLDPDGAETINGDTTFDLIADESLIVVDFSTEWRVF